MGRRVVVTGMGGVTPLGNDIETFWESIKKGTNGIDEITCFDTSRCSAKLAAEVKNLNVEDYLDRKEARRMDRFSQFAIIAAREAAKDARNRFKRKDRYRSN